jgi:nucleotide-binding universal stress UspA family protein
MLKKVLVPLDGSPLSEQSLPVVQALVEGSSARVTLFMVGKPPSATRESGTIRQPVPVTTSLPGAAPSGVIPVQTAGYAENRDQAVERGENALIDALGGAAQQLSRSRAHVEVKVAFGDPAREIISLATKEGFDVICMATHGRSGLREVLHGSVTEAVIRSRVAPVLVVPAMQPGK